MRLLLLGATTPLGRATIRALLEDPAHRVTLVEPVPKGSEDPRVVCHAIDCGRERELHDLLFGPGRDVEAIIDLSLHGSSEGAPVGEVERLRRVLHLCHRHPGVRRAVVATSSRVYRVQPEDPELLDEEHPLELARSAPPRTRALVEADTLAVAHRAPPAVAVLRLADLVAPGCAAPLWELLCSQVVMRPLGYDPVLNLLSIRDATRAIRCALDTDSCGAYNVPGADTLPLSRLIRLMGRRDMPLPGPLLGPLHRLRGRLTGHVVDYRAEATRLHFTCTLDGRRASRELGYKPSSPIEWSSDGTRVGWSQGQSAV